MLYGKGGEERRVRLSLQGIRPTDQLTKLTINSEAERRRERKKEREREKNDGRSNSLAMTDLERDCSDRPLILTL